MGPVVPDVDTEDRWVRVAATRDSDTADRWRDAVDAAEVAVEVHIEDAREALPGTAAVPELVLGIGFAFGVWVPRDRRAEAVRALIDAGWDGRHGSVDTATPPPGAILLGALLALAAAAAIVIVRVALT